MSQHEMIVGQAQHLKKKLTNFIFIGTLGLQ